jgi:hypothetical protein
LFTQSSPVHEPLLQVFPFPSTLGEVTLHPLSQVKCLFTVHMVSGSSLLSCGIFFPPLLLQAFPFLIAGHVLLHLLADVFVYSSNGKWVISPLLWSFPPSATLTSFLTSGCWVCTAAPTLSGYAQLVYLQFWEGFPCPPLQCSGHPTLFATCLYCYYCLVLSFSFSPGVGQSVQGAMLIWPGVVCGSTTYCLAHLVRVFPSHLGMGVLWPGSPPGFSI